MNVKSQLKCVVENSDYVKINYTKLEDFISNLEKTDYQHWYSFTSLNLSERKRIMLAFIIESLNFCFWQKPKFQIEYKGNIIKGSEALFYSIIKEVESNKNFLNIDFLYKLTKEKFEKLFYSSNSEISLIDLRYNLFKDTVNIIYKKGQKFFDELFNKKSDIDLLKYIVSEFKYFDDSSNYKGKRIEFNKRATLLVNDLYYMSPTIHNNIGNVDNLTGCADYGIPGTLRAYGILEYNETVTDIVDREEELEHDSDMEIEIRANMLYVLEIIRKRLEDKGIKINSVELDNIIWQMGKRKKNITPYHHTTTIFY